MECGSISAIKTCISKKRETKSSCFLTNFVLRLCQYLGYNKKMKCPFCEKLIEKWTGSRGEIILGIEEECECPFCNAELICTIVEISYDYGGMVLVPRDDVARMEYEEKMGY